jgi:hypothetical protein
MFRQLSMAAGVVPQSSCSFRPMAPAAICWLSASRAAGVALAQEAQVHREGIGRLQHAVDVLRPRRAGGGEGAGGRAGAAAQHGGHAAHQRLFDLLRADEVDVAVDAAGGDDHAFAGNDLGARADDDVHARLHVGVAGLADGRDAAALDADVGLDDAPVVDDQRVGDHAVHRLRAGAVDALALAHAVADGLAAAELDFFAVAAGLQREVLLDLDDQAGVGQAHAVAHGGAEHLGVGASVRSWVAITALLGQAAEAPDLAVAGVGHQFTVRCWPGSKRTAVPLAMFSRMPLAAARSKRSAGLVSAKW